MDTSLANLESCNTFHRFHEELNRVIKINVIALTLLRFQLDSGITESEVKTQVYESGNLWGGMPSWKNPYELLKSAANDLGQNGVVRVFSAFDLFLTSFEGELQSWNSFINPKARKSSSSEKDLKSYEEEPDRLFKFIGKTIGRLITKNISDQFSTITV